MTNSKELPKRMLRKAAESHAINSATAGVRSIAEKEAAYRMQTRYNLLGHRYIGFEGKRCSQMHCDDRKRTMEECAWVWDAQKRRWIKKPAA